LSVPSGQQRNGDFNPLGFRNNRPIYDPATTRANPAGTGFLRDPFPGNLIPGPRIGDFARTVLSFYPLPTTGAAAGNNFFAGVSYTSDNNQGIARVDHRFNQSNSVFYRFSIFDGPQTNRSPIDYSGSTTLVRTYNMAFSHLCSFSASLVNELRLGYNRPTYLVLQDGAFGKDFATLLGLKNLLRDPIAWGPPNISLTGFSGVGNMLNPTTQVSNVYHLVDHVSIIRGPHTMKTGIDFRKTNYNDRSEISARGSFGFTGVMTALPGTTDTGVSLADLLLGLPINASGSSTSLAGNFNGFTYAFFLQDDWRIGRRLTLNMGLRYELNTRYTDVQNRLTLFDPAYPGGRLLIAGSSKAWVPAPTAGVADSGVRTPRGLLPNDTNNWAPRIGIAFRPFGDNRAAIRAGYGITYDPIPFGRPLRGLYPATLSANWVPQVSVFGWYNTIDQGIPDVPTPDISSGVIPLPLNFDMGPRSPWGGMLNRGYIQSWNFTIERQLPFNIVASAGYVATRTIHQLMDRNINTVGPGLGVSTANLPLAKLYGKTVAANMWDGWGYGAYDSLQVNVKKSYSGGRFLTVSYTFGKALNMADDTGWTGPKAFNWEGMLNRNYSPASYDRRHMFTMGWIYEMPFGKGRKFNIANRWAEAVAGGWRLSGMFSAYSGTPFTVTGSSQSLQCIGCTQTAHQIGPVKKLGGKGPGQPYYDPSSFRDPLFYFDSRNPQYIPGSMGINALYGPGFWRLDPGLFKIFRLTERLNLEFRAESYNVAHNARWGNPNGNSALMLLRPDGSLDTSKPNPLQNFMSITSADSSRQFRFGLRLSF
jgi:hypothetical protein